MIDSYKDNVYFVGIGGIGMSALARYFAFKGMRVAGYDRVSTPLTMALESEGIAVHYDDDVALIDESFKDSSSTLVIYTPAVPKDHSELNFFMDGGFEVVKRSQALGKVAEGQYVMAVAGTHGKTSTTTMLAYFNSVAACDGDGEVGGGSAFLGGISKNFGSNLHLGRGHRLAVEADEFDRSFLQLRPDVAVVTAVDADHLDIYGSEKGIKEGFAQFVAQIKQGGTLIYKYGIDLETPSEGISLYSYALRDERADFYAKQIAIGEDGYYSYDIVCPDRVISGCRLSLAGEVNVENSIAAVAMMWVAGFDEEALKCAMAQFVGVKRRFDIQINRPGKIYIDDYAHHPEELRRTIESVREMFPSKSICAIFQPHLYSRTKDFAAEFAESLSLVDRLLLLPIYPARELPMEGVDSAMIARGVTIRRCELCDKSEALEHIAEDDSDIVITFGAGDIDALCDKIKMILE